MPRLWEEKALTTAHAPALPPINNWLRLRVLLVLCLCRNVSWVFGNSWIWFEVFLVSWEKERNLYLDLKCEAFPCWASCENNRTWLLYVYCVSFAEMINLNDCPKFGLFTFVKGKIIFVWFRRESSGASKRIPRDGVTWCKRKGGRTSRGSRDQAISHSENIVSCVWAVAVHFILWGSSFVTGNLENVRCWREFPKPDSEKRTTQLSSKTCGRAKCGTRLYPRAWFAGTRRVCFERKTNGGSNHACQTSTRDV